MFSLHSALLQRAKALVLTSFPSLLLIEAIIDDPNENSHSLDFPNGPVVKILPSYAGDAGSILGQKTKIPHVLEQVYATVKDPTCQAK